MDSLETNDQLTIVNRSMEHRISKKLIRKVPYFEKMLSHECLESKENKVELDFEEKALKSFLDWIELGYIFIEMDYIIDLCTILDYFGTKNHLIQDCFSYFSEKFSSEYLPVVIPQVTSTSALINSDTLDTFICRYFSKIANTNVWLDYPIETIEYICALDLMIHSEYQVFHAIMKWIDFKADSRKRYFKGLLNLVRWCHLEDNDLSKIKENELYESSDLEPESGSHCKSSCNCGFKRTKQGCFFAIEELNNKLFRVKVLDGNFRPLFNEVIQLDESLPLNLLYGKYISDIPLDSGRQMIRIDWKQNKYRLLNFDSYKRHYVEIHRLIFGSQNSVESYIEKKKTDDLSTMSIYKTLLLEAAEKYIFVCSDDYEFKCWVNPSTHGIYFAFDFDGLTHLATVLDNNVYVLTSDLKFFQFNIDRNMFEKIELPSVENKLKFDNLILTSKQAGDGGVILIDKSAKDVFCFNVSTRRWKSVGRIIDCKSEYNVLKTFTFGFVSTDSINLCLERKLTQ
ncbi:uncharacterized protein LOC107370816 [Tetranychus urticae]|uniref:uncharacterized protein LOC107370816 n=1 Tax=Tetranychus urticae TaxID=32264 RepID=UPI00077B9063|nr:uncharacterized protein LOC107370816 [Tetranychus urticae]